MHLFAGHLTILEPKFDARRTWEIIEREGVQLIFMTGDAMARPLIEAYEARPTAATTRPACSPSPAAPRSSAAPVKERWMAAFPNAFFTDSVGSSETGFQGMGLQDKDNISSDGPRGRARPEQRRHRRGQPRARPGATSARSAGSAAAARVPLGYYKDPEKSAKTFLEIDGKRYSVPGDFARIEADSKVTLLGRGSNCINTGGEKVYPEEVEMALKAHPDVYDVLVVGVPDEKYGQAVAAVDPAARGRPAELEELRDFLRAQLSGYKLPRSLTLVDEIPRSATGKANYPKAKELALASFAAKVDSPTGSDDAHRAVRRGSGSSTRSSRSPRPSTSPPRSRRAGGLGVLGCVRFNDPDELEQTLTWLDENTDGKPYGVDVVMPMKIPTEGKSVDLKAMIPEEHMTFVEQTLQKLGVPPLPEGEGREGVLGWLHSVARSHVDIALNAPAGADRQRARLAAGGRDRAGARAGVDGRGARRRRQARALARDERRRHHRGPGLRGRRPHRRDRQHGAHPGDRRRGRPRRPVLGAGGIGSGRQVAASLALGAQGVWTGSVWLTTEEYQNLNTNRGMTEAFLRAGSPDTVRTRVYTGKPARLLKTKWTEAWDEEDAPDAAADAAAEPARLRRAQPDERARRPRRRSRCRSARSSAG